MPDTFTLLVQHAVAPIVLISGVGLVLVSLNNRYMNAMSKTRAITGELIKTQDDNRRDNLKNQVAILLNRCRILRLSIAMVVASIVFSSFIVLTSITVAIWHIDPELMLMSLLFLSCISIMAANLLLFMDVVVSMRALKLEIEYSLSNTN